MAFSVHLFLMLLIFIQSSKPAAEQLAEIIDELNVRLEISTNVIYNPQLDNLNYLQKIQPISQLIITCLTESAFNGTELMQLIDERILFVFIVIEPPHELLQKLHFRFQNADFLTVIDEFQLEDTWLAFMRQAWKLGYIKLLLWHTADNGVLYETQLFPKVKLMSSNVQSYVKSRNHLRNMQGYEIRVSVYTNPPRSIVYEDKSGIQIYGGYYTRFIRHFLATHNATFVPVKTPNYSPRDCIKVLLAKEVDLCGDALAEGSDREFVVTHAIRMAYANIMVTNAKPLSSYRYLMAPFHTTLWICLIVYIALIVCFMSLIHWQQQRRWIFSKFLLEAISSLLFTAFELRDLGGRVRYILFAVLFIAGFIYSTYYLCYLKSILTTEVFEEQINSIEQLIAANISLIIDEYDRSLTTKYNMPDVLWQIIKVVPDGFVKSHRNRFDRQYAYILFTDGMDLIEYAQHHLKHPRMRRIPFKFFFLYAGIPMRESWFLRHHLSQAWSNAFESGLMAKLAHDAVHETMTSGVGLQFLATEYYEVKSLGLDYFVMPAMSLSLGIGLAFLSFVIELTVWRMRRDHIEQLV